MTAGQTECQTCRGSRHVWAPDLNAYRRCACLVQDQNRQALVRANVPVQAGHDSWPAVKQDFTIARESELGHALRHVLAPGGGPGVLYLWSAGERAGPERIAGLALRTGLARGMAVRRLGLTDLVDRAFERGPALHGPAPERVGLLALGIGQEGRHAWNGAIFGRVIRARLDMGLGTLVLAPFGPDVASANLNDPGASEILTRGCWVHEITRRA